jgi:hypothetical protein
MEFASMNAIVRLLAVYTGLSLLLCAFTRLEWSPLQPNGFGQWVALFLLIFPAAAAAEFIGERLFGKDAPARADESTTHIDCSWGRIVTGVGVLLVTFGVVLGVAWWLSHPAASI